MLSLSLVLVPQTSSEPTCRFPSHVNCVLSHLASLPRLVPLLFTSQFDSLPHRPSSPQPFLHLDPAAQTQLQLALTRISLFAFAVLIPTAEFVKLKQVMTTKVSN
jgi:hypothetical protein